MKAHKSRQFVVCASLPAAFLSSPKGLLAEGLNLQDKDQEFRATILVKGSGEEHEK